MKKNKKLSIVAGPPLEEEPDLGALTLGGYLREVTARYDDREALVLHEDGEEIRWTYGELWEHSVDVARALIACGVGKGTRVGVMMTNRPEFLSGVFGTALAGGVATTISTFSTPAELEYLLQSSACSVFLFERQILKRNFAQTLYDFDQAIATGVPGELRTIKFPFLRYLAAVGDGESKGVIEKWSDFIARGSDVSAKHVDVTAAAVTPSDPGGLFFSSGSTAKPKGVLNSHRGMAIQLWRFRRLYDVKDDVRTWSANGFFWSGNFAMAFGAGLTSGGSLVLQKTFDPDEALSLMEKEKVTKINAWPHQWAQLTAAPNWLNVDLSSLRYVDAKSPVAQHPTVSSTWREPYAAYGNTETFTISAVFPANTPEDTIAGSSGRPLPGNIIEIVDPFTGEVLPVGERGEIAVKGATLMLGYIGVPLEEVFDLEGYFHTGDGGYVDAHGRLYWEGRLNDIIKTGGANVSPVEVDAVLRGCEGIKVVQTVGVPHDTLGELVVSCVVCHSGASLDEATVRAFGKETLASFKVPRRVLFFSEGDLKTTGTAKIKTADLREMVVKRLTDQAG